MQLFQSFSERGLWQTWLNGWYHILGCRYQIADWVSARSSWLARQIRWPLGMGRPDRWPELHVLRAGGIGDALMSTPSLRLLKQVRPQIRIVFYTLFPEAFRGLPFLDEVRGQWEFPRRSAVNVDAARVVVNYGYIYRGYRDRSVELVYIGSRDLRRHIARIHGDQLGLDVSDIRPSCAFSDDLIRQYQEAWGHLPRPWVVVNRKASSHTPNKEWPAEHWEQLIVRLLDRYTVIEIGEGGGPRSPLPHPHYVDLTGKLPLERFLAVVAAGDIHVGPDSGPAHVAAAAGKPAVVIFGGYVHPDTFGYPNNVNLFTELPCSPCWLRTPCPYDRACLRRISPEQVAQAVDTLGRERIT
jgi:ADP-heptose:LPS heptosyltransferase